MNSSKSSDNREADIRLLSLCLPSRSSSSVRHLPQTSCLRRHEEGEQNCCRQSSHLSTSNKVYPRKSSSRSSSSHCALILLICLSTTACLTTATSSSQADLNDYPLLAEESKYSFKGFASGPLITLNETNGESTTSSILHTSPLLISTSLSSPTDDLPEDEAIEELPTPQPRFSQAESLIREKRVDDNPIEGDEIKIDGFNEDLSTEQSAPSIVASLPTVTVRGFLNFRTTVDGTVIVFTPSSAAPSSSSSVYFAEISSPTTSTIKPTANFDNPFANYKTSSNPGLSNLASQWSSSYKAQVSSSRHEVTPTPTFTTQQVYPTGLVSLLSDTVEGDDGKTTVQETKIIGTYIEGKYAQILKSSSYVKPASTPIIPSGTFKVGSFSSSQPSQNSPVFNGNSFANRHEVRKPALVSSSNFKPPKTDRNTRVIRNNGSANNNNHDQPTSSNEEHAIEEGSRAKIRRPSRHWNRPASERPNRLSRFKIKVNGQEVSNSPLPSSGPSSRFTARDESEKASAKLLNQRLNRRLGATRGLHLSSKQEVNEKKIEKKADVSALPLIEGLLTESSNDKHDESEEHVIQPSKRVVSEIQTYMSEVTRGFEAGEPLIETITLTTTIERTLDPSEELLFPSAQPLTSLPHFSSEATPPIVLTKTYTVTESSSRTSLVPATDGPSTTTITLTENFLITKMITAFKTIPAEVGVKYSNVVNSILDEMNNSDYADNLIPSEQQHHSVNQALQGAVFQGNLDVLSITPTSPSMMINMMSSTDFLTNLQPSLNTGNLNGLLSNNNSPFGPQIDLNNPLIVGAALQNPNLAAMYFGLQQLSQQATQYSTIMKPTDVTTTETVFATKTLSFYDGRQTRTRTITEPASTTIKVFPTTIQEVQPIINPQILVQQAQLQRAFASQLLQSSNQQNNNNNNNNGQQNQQQQPSNQNLQSLIPNLFVPPPSGQNPFQNQNLPSHLTPLQNAFLQQQQNQQQQNNNNALQGLLQNQIKPSTVTESVTTVTTTTSLSTKVYTLIYNALSTKYRTVTSSSIFPTTVTEVITKTITPTNSFNFFG